MKKKEALKKWHEYRKRLLEQIPYEFEESRRMIDEVMSDSIGGGRHISCIYEAGLELGNNFAVPIEYRNHQDYLFWIRGIERHLCRAIEMIQNYNPNFDIEDVLK
jgi:hypothetical protein